mgnify:CR=1 FL=1
MNVKYRGALTFDSDEALTKALDDITRQIQSQKNSFLTMEHIEPLGLHVTVHQSGNASPEQIQFSRQILKSLASTAYSGYVDVWIDDHDDSERYHAKEINPKVPTVDDIVST